MLDNKEIARWLDGIVPAWSLLTPESFNSLQRPPSTARTAIRLAADLSMDEVSTSPMARNALIVLEAAAKPPGLKLTSTGNLSRHVVAAMFERLDWPRLERDVIVQLHKVINEPDFLPLYFVRKLMEASRVVRRLRKRTRAMKTKWVTGHDMPYLVGDYREHGKFRLMLRPNFPRCRPR